MFIQSNSTSRRQNHGFLTLHDMRISSLTLLIALISVLGCKKKGGTEIDPVDTRDTVAIEKITQLLPPKGVQGNSYFNAFYSELERAVKVQDREFIEKHISEKAISLTGSGKEQFISHWDIDNAFSPFWSHLEQALRVGGSFDKESKVFIAPYFSGNFPEEYDRQSHGIANAEGVSLREDPSIHAPRIARLNYDIVEVLPQKGIDIVEETLSGETHPWIKVKTIDGQIGFIFGKYISRPNDQHVRIELINSEWRITQFAPSN